MTRIITDWYWPLDGWIIAIGVLCAASAALLGSFLVLRRLSLLGDGISHAILPGLALAFMWTASRSGWPVFAGAIVAGLLTALASQWLQRRGRVDEGAALGVVFTTLFAIGLILINYGAARVDLDPGCVLYGAIEFTPLDRVSLAGWEMPRAFLVQLIVLVLNAAFVMLFYKELKIATFAPEYAESQGIPVPWLHRGLMVLVAITAVASFESVGSILVVAMLVVPPATALLVVSRLRSLLIASVILGAIGAIAGHLAAISVPRWFGLRSASTAGMMAVAVGGLFMLVCLVSPRCGLLAAGYRGWSLRLKIAFEDVLACLYRRSERGARSPAKLREICDRLGRSPVLVQLAIWRYRRRGLLVRSKDGWELTESGFERAEELVRSHRLWETYLAENLAMPAERLHEAAESLEHFTAQPLRSRLAEEISATEDPHGAPIPPARGTKGKYRE